MFVVVFILVITPAIVGGLEISTITAVSRWFAEKRGLAFSIASLGFALGAAAIAPVLSVAVQGLGWRATVVIIGAAIWIVIPALWQILRRLPESADQEPYGPAQLATPPGKGYSPMRSPQAASEAITFRAAIRTRAYRFLVLSYSLRGMVGAAISLHLVPIMVWRGLDEGIAGVLLGVSAFFWIPAGLVIGWIADRGSKQRIAAASTWISALGMLLLALWSHPGVWGMVAIFVLLAPNEGTWPLSSAMMADRFGLKDFGLLRGSQMAVVSFFSIGTPFYGGWIYDHTGSYFWVVMPAALLLASAALLNWLMPKQAPVRVLA